MVRDPFLDGEYCIHIASVTEAEDVYDHYERVWGIDRRNNTSDVTNCMRYPYLVMSWNHIGANASRYSQACMEYSEWAAFVGFAPEGDLHFSYDHATTMSVLFGGE